MAESSRLVEIFLGDKASQVARPCRRNCSVLSCRKKGKFCGIRLLNGGPVRSAITAYLFHAGGDDDPDHIDGAQ